MTHELLFFIAIQQFLYAIAWVMGYKFIIEIRPYAFWFSLFALFLSFYFLLSPLPYDVETNLRIFINQFILLLVMFTIRRATELFHFSVKSEWRMDATLIFLFSGIGVIGIIFSYPSKLIVMLSVYLFTWFLYRVIIDSYRKVWDEFGLTLVVVLKLPLVILLLGNIVEIVGSFYNQSILFDIYNGAITNKLFVYFVLFIVGLIHVSYVVMIIKRLIDNLNILSKTDVLTELFNRRALIEIMEYQMILSKRNQEPFSVLMLDIDFFKSINDCFGHVWGDEVLKKIAITMKEMARSTDYVARYGGEEFVVVLPRTSIDAAVDIAERLRFAIDALCFSNQKIHITVSIGIAESLDEDVTFDEILNRADDALYDSKEKGRNCISIFKNDLKE